MLGLQKAHLALLAEKPGDRIVIGAAGRAYHDAVARFLGEQREMRFLQPERRSFFRALFGKA